MNKTLKTLILCIALPLSAFCQIPNPSFENWTDSLPDAWTSNSMPPNLLPISQSTDAHVGNYALKGQIVDDGGVAFGPFMQPTTSNFGFPVSQNYATLYGWFKSSLIGTNLGLVEVWAFDSVGTQVGVGVSYLPVSSSYQQFTIPIIYVPGANATEMSIIIQMTDTSVAGGFNIGSYFLIDGLSYQQTTTDVNDIKRKFYSVGPNPAFNTITINRDFESNKKQLVTIYEAMGKIVLNESLSPGSAGSSESIDVSRLTSGCYLMTITDGEHSTSEKIMIQN